MVQDGVGVVGLDNLDGVDLLLVLLCVCNVDFDVVVELFEELVSLFVDGSYFQVQIVDVVCIVKQLVWVECSGVVGVFVFVLDLWLLQDILCVQVLCWCWCISVLQCVLECVFDDFVQDFVGVVKDVQCVCVGLCVVDIVFVVVIVVIV